MVSSRNTIVTGGSSFATYSRIVTYLIWANAIRVRDRFTDKAYIKRPDLFEADSSEVGNRRCGVALLSSESMIGARLPG